MRKFIVNVNGSTYEIEVEEISGAFAQSPAAAAPVPAAAPVAAAPKAAAAPVVASKGQETVSAPMPGTILGVKVNVGDTVKNGDVLVILEAMKMENEIVAPKGGTIVGINVSKGSSVSTGDPLCVIG
ncbi:MAG: biotin/lipoyl-containing protein [Bacillota bacterium]